MEHIIYNIDSNKPLMFGRQYDHRVKKVTFEGYERRNPDSVIFFVMHNVGLYPLADMTMEVIQKFTMNHGRMTGQLVEYFGNVQAVIDAVTAEELENAMHNVEMIGHSNPFDVRVEWSSDTEQVITDETPETSIWLAEFKTLYEAIKIQLEEHAFDGVGIERIELKAVDDKVKTYEIIFTNGNTFDFNIKDGDDGNSVTIVSIEEGPEVNTITFSDGHVMHINNGKGMSDADKAEIVATTKQKVLAETYDRNTIDQKIADATPADYDQVKADVQNIKGVIPEQATEENQLADKEFVNSSVANNTAYFVGVFNSVAELEAYAGPLTNNDYAFVVAKDEDGNTLYKRYKYNSSTKAWMFEFDLNNSSFTAAQWAAIQSGITESLVTKLDGIEEGAQKNLPPYNDEPIKEEISQIKEGLSARIEKPTDAPIVGKVLKVKSVNEDGTFVCEWAETGGGNVDDVRFNGNSIVDDNKIAQIEGTEANLIDLDIEKPFRHIKTIEITDSAKDYVGTDTDKDGNPFNASEFDLRVYMPPSEGEYFCVTLNSTGSSLNHSNNIVKISNTNFKTGVYTRINIKKMKHWCAETRLCFAVANYDTMCNTQGHIYESPRGASIVRRDEWDTVSAIAFCSSKPLPVGTVIEIYAR